MHRQLLKRLTSRECTSPTKTPVATGETIQSKTRKAWSGSNRNKVVRQRGYHCAETQFMTTSDQPAMGPADRPATVRLRAPTSATRKASKSHRTIAPAEKYQPCVGPNEHPTIAAPSRGTAKHYCSRLTALRSVLPREAALLRWKASYSVQVESVHSDTSPKSRTNQPCHRHRRRLARTKNRPRA